VRHGGDPGMQGGRDFSNLSRAGVVLDDFLMVVSAFLILS